MRVSKSIEERKAAQRRSSLAWYYRHREQANVAHKGWVATHKEHVREYRKCYNERIKKEKLREWHRRYYHKNKVKIRAKSKAYREAHKIEILEYRERVREREIARRRDPNVKARAYETNRLWRSANKSRIKEQVRQYRATHPKFREYLRMKSAWSNAERDNRCRIDARYYADVRAYDRRRKAKKCLQEGREYKPVMSRRIPDRLVKGDARLDSMPVKEDSKRQRFDTLNRGSK